MVTTTANRNLDRRVQVGDALKFLTSQRYTVKKPGKGEAPVTLPIASLSEDQLIRDPHYPQRAWKFVTKPPPEEQAWREREGYVPGSNMRTSYWIVRCGPEIIKNHGDVWNVNAMEMYAAIYRLVDKRRSV